MRTREEIESRLEELWRQREAIIRGTQYAGMDPTKWNRSKRHREIVQLELMIGELRWTLQGARARHGSH